jgi:hypothetical protein
MKTLSNTLSMLLLTTIWTDRVVMTDLDLRLT